MTLVQFDQNLHVQLGWITDGSFSANPEIYKTLRILNNPAARIKCLTFFKNAKNLEQYSLKQAPAEGLADTTILFIEQNHAPAFFDELHHQFTQHGTSKRPAGIGWNIHKRFMNMDRDGNMSPENIRILLEELDDALQRGYISKPEFNRMEEALRQELQSST